MFHVRKPITPAHSMVAKIRLALGSEHEYVFVDGAVATTPAPGNPCSTAKMTAALKDAGVEAIASPGDEFLRFAEEGDIPGYQTVYRHLEELVAAEGPFDAVMAFSEGAAVASSLIVDCIRSSSIGKASPFDFKCAIFFCAGNPIDINAMHRNELVYLDCEKDGALISIPTAHIWAREDNVHRGFGRRLSKVCHVDTKEEFIHDLGHTIPGAQSGEGVPETVCVIRRTIDRATA
jgi:hypothetical protein